MLRERGPWIKVVTTILALVPRRTLNHLAHGWLTSTVTLAVSLRRSGRTRYDYALDAPFVRRAEFPSITWRWERRA